MKKLLSALLVLSLVVVPLSPALAAEAGEAPFTRATFAQFIVDALELEYTESMALDYPDLPRSHPNYEAMCVMVNARLFSNVGGSYMDPDRQFSRAEAAAVLGRMLSATGAEVNVSGVTWPDDVGSSHWASDYVRVCLALGVMGVDGQNRFRPNDNAYPSEVNLSPILAALAPTTTDPVSLDLSLGSITVEKSNFTGLTVFKQGDTKIRAKDPKATIRQSDTTATVNGITSNADVTLTLAGVNTTGNVDLEDALLILVGENTVGDIRGGDVTIQGSGSLSTSHIGANALIINSGNVTVINSSSDSEAAIDGGDIIINGGVVVVNKTPDWYGWWSAIDGNNITICGGTVTASSSGGPAIGGDQANITIVDGYITATGIRSDGHCPASAIGGYHANVTIIGGTVTATGTYDSIGGRFSSNGEWDRRNSYACASITIGEDADLTLIQTEKERLPKQCADFQEHISGLELSEYPALAGHPLGMTTAAHSHSGIASYQWQVSPDNSSSNSYTNLEGQTAATLTLPMTQELDGQYFRCKITNVYGNVVYTDAAQGYVLAFRQQPQSIETGLNETASLTVASTCTNVTYRWERSYDDGETWSDVPGEIYPTLIVSTTRSENGALYRCVITAPNGDALASDSAEITVNTGDVGYAVRYYQENADGVGYTAVTQDSLPGTVGQTVTAPAKSFPGFTENTSQGVHSGVVTSNGSLVLSRYYDRNTYEINLNMNGAAALPPISAKYGAAVKAPMQPTRYGYAFGGWFADAALTQSYTFSTMPLNGATVYAKWTAKDEGRGIEYSIDDLLIRNPATLEPLERIPTGDFFAEVSVTNLCSHEMDTVLLTTYDANGKMLDMYYLYANPAVGQSITLGTRVKNPGNVAKLKAFVLPSLNSATPLAEAKEK